MSLQYTLNRLSREASEKRMNTLFFTIQQTVTEEMRRRASEGYTAGVILLNNNSLQMDGQEADIMRARVINWLKEEDLNVSQEDGLMKVSWG